MTEAQAIILLIDDDEAKRYLMSTWLRRAGYTVIEAGTGREGLDLVGDAELVLLDVNLPDGNGLTLAADLAERDARPRVIALTASVLPHERAAAMSAGCDAFLDKPYAAQDLLDVLAEHLPK